MLTSSTFEMTSKVNLRQMMAVRVKHNKLKVKGGKYEHKLQMETENET